MSNQLRTLKTQAKDFEVIGIHHIEMTTQVLLFFALLEAMLGLVG
jgi:hypothetical protein